MQEIWVRSLGQEDLLKEGMATHSSILAWKVPWTEEPGRLQSSRSQRVRYDWATKHTHKHNQNFEFYKKMPLISSLIVLMYFECWVIFIYNFSCYRAHDILGLLINGFWMHIFLAIFGCIINCPKSHWLQRRRNILSLTQFVKERSWGVVLAQGLSQSCV